MAGTRRLLSIAIMVTIASLVFIPVYAGAAGEKNCLVYFTATFCPNCAVTDPVVLGQWPCVDSGIVIIEYMFEGWTDPNAFLLGQYGQEYNAMSAVPTLFVSDEEVLSGRIDIASFDTGSLASNRCVGLGESVPFSELDISSLPGDPLKIWANGRLLLRKGGGTVPDEMVRELLFAEDLQSALDASECGIRETEAEPALISGGSIQFQKAVTIGDSWVLQFNDDVELPAPRDDSNATNNTCDDEYYIELPFFGRVDITATSLPALTVMIGLADGFNPCAFFILSFLLGSLVYAMSRKRILIVGFIFVFFSAFIYFLFMGAWLNVFLFGSQIALLTVFAGIVAVIAGLINIKDFFFFKKGISLTLPSRDKVRFMKRVEDLAKHAESTPALIGGTVLIAATVNLYELLCTVGFPMVYTRILTLQNLPPLIYYTYIAFYNVMYIIPITIIVLLFALTLGSKKFGVENVRNLKLFSGMLIFLFGLNLILNPNLLENVGFMFTIILASVAVSAVALALKYTILKGRKCQGEPKPKAHAGHS